MDGVIEDAGLLRGEIGLWKEGRKELRAEATVEDFI
jgi:hypothetical protein